jgi:hypothetical protein
MAFLLNAANALRQEAKSGLLKIKPERQVQIKLMLKKIGKQYLNISQDTEG